jgi:D-alanyl-D-alanine dipeptidase
MFATTPSTTLTAADYERRRALAVEHAAGAGLTGVLVTPGPDLIWLTGYQPAITERLTVLWLSVDGTPAALLVPTLERPDADAASGAERLQLLTWNDAEDPYAAVADLLPSQGRFGISDSAWSLHLLGLQAAMPRASYDALTTCLPMMRAVKDDNEIERLAMAGVAADATFEQIVTLPFAGRLETDVAADLSRLLKEFGHEQVDFTIVGSGPNGANPHHQAGDRRIEVGDLVVLDFGGLMNGYGSDTTRTVCVGKPSAEASQVHGIVLQAQEAAFQSVRPGIACQDVDRVARAVITEAGYGEQFIHRTGHGIGVTTHEPPYMVEGETQPLVPGMCFSIEPGIYLAGRFGVRIEDIVTVTDDAGRRLNNTSRELRVVD